MAWTIRFQPKTEKDLCRLGHVEQRRVIAFLTERVAVLEDPRILGEGLHGPKLGKYWKYRVGDCRVVCDIQDAIITILVVQVGHRREIFR